MKNVSKEIKRYRPEGEINSQFGSAYMEQDPEGNWVSYDDYVAALDRAEKAETIDDAFNLGRVTEIRESSEACDRSSRDVIHLLSVLELADRLADAVQDLPDGPYHRLIHDLVAYRDARTPPPRG